MTRRISISALRKLDAAVFDYRPAEIKARITQWLQQCVKDETNQTVVSAKLEIAIAIAAVALFEIGIERITPIMGDDYARELLIDIFDAAGDGRRRARR